MKRSGKSYNQQIQCSASNRTLQLWTHSPYEPHVDGDWLYGRGSGDMKAGLVAFCLAFQALRDMGLQPASPVILQSVIEEECTGNGALACLEADAHKQITGTECKGVASTATTDARFFQIYGRISATCYDPTAENIHGINERVSISSTLQVAEVLALFLANWCSVETL